MAFKGPTAKLEQLQRFMARGVPVAKRGINKALSAEAISRVQQGFRDQIDPYGWSWKALKPSTVKRRRKGKRKGFGPQILLNTARLRNSFSAPWDEEGFKVGSNVRYAVYHQQPDGPGKGIIPRRMMVPKRGELGEWERPFIRVATRFLREWARNVE